MEAVWKLFETYAKWIPMGIPLGIPMGIPLEIPIGIPMGCSSGCSDGSGPDGSVVAAGVKGKILLMKVFGMVGGNVGAKDLGIQCNLQGGEMMK